VRPGRVVEDFINVRDFMPTYLAAAGVTIPDSVTGRSFLDALKSDKSGLVDTTRNRHLVGKERHDIGRPHDLGYPVRAIRTPDYLYIRNYEPDRWPAGNPETGYRNVDDSPTKQLILSSFDRYFQLSFGKRPAEELYRVGGNQDFECLNNLASDPVYEPIRKQLATELEAMLRKEGDPRALGNGKIFDTYKYLGNRKHSWEAWKANQ
jgi:arylsulfatase A-like enzyme